MCIKHLVLATLHWMVAGSSYPEYGNKDGAYYLGVAPSTVKSLHFYLGNRCKSFVADLLKPRSLEEMLSIGEEFYANHGFDCPSPAFKRILYYGDGKHYRTWLPRGNKTRPQDKEKAEKIRTQNKGQWGKAVQVGPDVYSKWSHKPGTYNLDMLCPSCILGCHWSLHWCLRWSVVRLPR